jgi:hypothetical protein
MATLVLQLQRQLVSYTVMLIVPLLRRMSDAVPAVRRKAALCFGSLTALLPLAHGLPLPEGLDAGQRADAQRDGEFLSQLLDNRRVEDYSLPMQLKVRRCCMWLHFLLWGLHKQAVLVACLASIYLQAQHVLVSCKLKEHSPAGHAVIISSCRTCPPIHHASCCCGCCCCPCGCCVWCAG